MEYNKKCISSRFLKLTYPTFNYKLEVLELYLNCFSATLYFYSTTTQREMLYFLLPYIYVTAKAGLTGLSLSLSHSLSHALSLSHTLTLCLPLTYTHTHLVEQPHTFITCFTFVTLDVCRIELLVYL